MLYSVLLVLASGLLILIVLVSVHVFVWFSVFPSDIIYHHYYYLEVLLA